MAELPDTDEILQRVRRAGFHASLNRTIDPQTGLPRHVFTAINAKTGESFTASSDDAQSVALVIAEAIGLKVEAVDLVESGTLPAASSGRAAAQGSAPSTTPTPKNT